LIAAHLNHQLRGAESNADESFVHELCARQGIDCVCEQLAVQPVAEGSNLEATARTLRYDALTRIARARGAVWVATGHTSDDQAETVLHRLLRGTGLKGLRGIAPRRELMSGVTLIRPLLAVSRAEVIAYLDKIGQSSRQDSSNLDPAFTRNRIRHELLPLLAHEYNPEITAVLSRVAGQAEEVYAAEEEQARALLLAAELPRAGDLLVFDRQQLGTVPRGRLREMFRLVWEREDWPMGAMGFDAWERVAAVALGELATTDLPGKIRVHCRERVVQVG
jgi:tRNA(Ile)-lysidine synthase